MGFWGSKKPKQEKSTGFPGDCSEQQKKALALLKQHVNKTNPINKQQYDDVYLLRFLRARKFDIQKTTKMWDNFIDWRVKNSIDNCRDFKFPTLPQLRHMYPHGYHKVDKQFRPVYIQRVGMIDLDKVFDVMKTEDMLKYYALLYETLLTTIFDGCTKARIAAKGDNTRVTQTVTILDLKNVKLSNASKSYDFVKPVSAMAQDNYPQILGNMFIINAPMLFTGIWQIVKMWIDDKTKEKIKILGSSYKKELLEYIDAENLPDFLDGGKSPCTNEQLSANIGPWNPEGKQMFEENIYGKKEEEKIQPQKSQKEPQLNIPDEPKQQNTEETEKIQSKPSVLLSGPPPQDLPQQNAKVNNVPEPKVEQTQVKKEEQIKNKPQQIKTYTKQQNKQQQNNIKGQKLKGQEIKNEQSQNESKQAQNDNEQKDMINKGAQDSDQKNPISDSQLPSPSHHQVHQDKKQEQQQAKNDDVKNDQKDVKQEAEEGKTQQKKQGQHQQVQGQKNKNQEKQIKQQNSEENK